MTVFKWRHSRSDRFAPAFYPCGGLNYNMELRWDGIPSLADAIRRLQEQVARTPAPQ